MFSFDFALFSVVLAINTFNGSLVDYKGKKQAFSIDPSGGYDELNFDFADNTEVDNSCSLVFNNMMYVFGGSNERRQISQVTGCGLERIGNLAFDFSGACTVISNKEIMLCFSWWNGEGRVCRVGQSPTGSFNTIKQSNYHHYLTHIASNEGTSRIFLIFCLTHQIDTVMAVGSRNHTKYVKSENGHNLKTKKMNICCYILRLVGTF